MVPLVLPVTLLKENKLREKLQLAASVFTHAREGILITTADASIIDVNETFSRITGYRHDELIGRNRAFSNLAFRTKPFMSAFGETYSKTAIGMAKSGTGVKAAKGVCGDAHHQRHL